MVAVVEKPRFSRKWDYGIMVTLAGGLLAAIMYIAGAEIGGHDSNAEAHPQIQSRLTAHDGSLNRIEAALLRESIMSMDARLCEDPNNNVYRNELARLISAWEALTKRTFPRELLRCSR